MIYLADFVYLPAKFILMNDIISLPSIFSTLPFVALLFMIATGPVLYPHFWHRYYPHISIGLGTIVLAYYTIGMEDYFHCIEVTHDYLLFILLIGALYIVSGSILITLNGQGSIGQNLVLLWSGAILSNFIGTTGASMLLIRPYMRLNKKNLQPYHIIFFIFMVSNVGGALTPIGDPPIFLGFLRGVPFFSTLWSCFLPWLVTLTLLSLAFYSFARKEPHKNQLDNNQQKIKIRGKRNFLFFIIIISAVFLDPTKISWIPAITYHGHSFSFLRELILLSVIIISYNTADKELLKENNFSLEPLKEVGFLFIGIFFTMMPALALIGDLAIKQSAWITPSALYWATGILSGVLDNAPTYLSFLTAGMGAKGLHINLAIDVLHYVQEYKIAWRAISMSAVFFGAMTYVGNAPNFMVSSIAEEQGIKMPSFGSYLLRFSLPILLPILAIVWLLFVFLSL